MKNACKTFQVPIYSRTRCGKVMQEEDEKRRPLGLTIDSEENHASSKIILDIGKNGAIIKTDVGNSTPLRIKMKEIDTINAEAAIEAVEAVDGLDEAVETIRDMAKKPDPINVVPLRDGDDT